MKRLLRVLRHSTLVGLALLLVLALLPSPQAHAGPASGFEAGRIIDDTVFLAYKSMSTSSIQSFLNAKGSGCTSGSNCLKNYRTSGKSAAQIIYEAAQKYRINPQVLIVLLQKETGLVTMNNPASWRYRTATGYGCPDTAACDSKYYGLINQLNCAAKMFSSIIRRDPDWYSPYRAGNNPRVYWHPDTGRCGSKSLYIYNWSTAALYSYTPYRPNQAALDAGYGTGNSCSSYGNRNFYIYFKEWFGNPKGSLKVGYYDVSTSISPSSPARVRFWIRNDSKQNMNVGRIKAVVRSSDSRNFDFNSSSEITLKPGQTYWYDQSRVIPEEGVFTFTIGRYADGSWRNPPFSDLGYTGNPIISRTVIKIPTLDTPLAVTPGTSQHINEPINTSFKVTNNSDLYDVNIGRMKAVVRSSSGSNYDFGSSDDLTLNPGEDYIYNKSRTFSRLGTYTVSIQNYKSTRGWSASYPTSASGSFARSKTLTVKDRVTLTRELKASGQLLVGKPVTATFTIHNYSQDTVSVGRLKAVVRSSSGSNYDFGSSPEITLGPGEGYVYSKTRTFSKKDTYSISIQNYRSQYGWSSTYPMNEWNSYTRSLKLTIK